MRPGAKELLANLGRDPFFPTLCFIAGAFAVTNSFEKRLCLFALAFLVFVYAQYDIPIQSDDPGLYFQAHLY